ncbi:AtpZ/AtpI family protein [Acuticoccus sp.]|uniref:AtpZ/AtpI family protein n=1 Tax=Acuticoccus sp. TaxID=1904378 RepID=UPI003B527014
MANDEFEARRDRLQRTLSEREAAERAEAERANTSALAGYAAAFRLSTEFISAIAVGVVIGFALDWWLGTTPWLAIAFLMLGFVAGVLNVLRSAGLIQSPQPGKRPPAR